MDQNADENMPDQIDVSEDAGKVDESAAGAPPGQTFSLEEQDLQDPKLMEEILKYNKKREQLNAKNQAELEKQRQKMMQPPKKAIVNYQAPSMFYKEEEKPDWNQQNDVDMEEMNKLFQISHSLPKIELHAHIGGCIRPQTFMDLVVKKNIDIDHIDFYNVDYKQAFEIFKITSQLVTDNQTLDRVTQEIIEDYAKQNCRYIELRSTPKIIGSITSLEMYIETILKAMMSAEQKQKSITCAYLASVNRTVPVEKAKETVDTIIALKEKWGKEDSTDEQKAMLKKIVGIELGGDAKMGHFGEELQAEFRRARENGFKVSLHCSEVKEQNDSDDMIAFKPERLGHCVFLSNEQIKQVVELDIAIEICPTSNVASAQCAIPEMLPHLQKLKKYDDPNLIICCDDTLLFNTNLSTEFFEFAKAMKMTDLSQIKKFAIKNIDAIFTDDDELKEQLKKEIENKY